MRDENVKVVPMGEPTAVESEAQGIKEKNSVKKEKSRPIKNAGKTTSDDDVIKKPKKTTYGETKIEKLIKCPKGLLTDLDKIPSLTPEQMEKYLSAIVLGLIPDKFGLEVGADTKIKAIAELSKLKSLEQQGGSSYEQVVIIDDIPDTD